MTGTSCQMSDLHLLNLPDVVLEKTLSFLTYDEIARARSVCRKFDIVCKVLLNRGFLAAERFHAQCLKSVKAQLPKRESERRTHPMSRHCDILTAVETRLSMLSMTFMRYVDVKVCCFIPGKVIDEIFRVLHYVKSCTTPPRAHEMLQELRDISSMAMEHFDESVVPRLKQALVNNANRNLSVATASNLGILAHTPVRAMALDKARLDYNRMQTRSKHNKKSVDNLKKMLRQLRVKVKRQGMHLARQNRRLTEQAQKLSEQDTVIAELKKHLQEWDHILGHHKSALLSGIATSVQEPTAEVEKPASPRVCNQVATGSALSTQTSPVSPTSPSLEKATESLEADVDTEDSESKESNCDSPRGECSNDNSTCEVDRKGNGTGGRNGARSKKVAGAKRKMKVEAQGEMTRSRYNPIIDAIRAKRVCLFLEELQG